MAKAAKKAEEAVPVVLDVRLATAPQGMVFCPKCGAIRQVDGAIPIGNACIYDNTPWATLDDIIPETYGADTQIHRKQICEALGKHGLTIPPNAEVSLFMADRSEGPVRMSFLMKAHTKADSYYYNQCALGAVESFNKKKSEAKKGKEVVPPPLDAHPDIRNPEPLMAVTIRQIRNATDTHAIRRLYFEVYGAEAGPSLTADNMKRSLESAIRELTEAKRRQPDVDDPGPLPPEQAVLQATVQQAAAKRMVAETLGSGAVITGKPKKSKMPVYQDRAAQIEREQKYPWIIQGSWRMDPDHDGGTLVDIKCQFCGQPRTIHLADAFQVKAHVECKKASKK